MRSEEKAKDPLNIDSWTNSKVKLENNFKKWKEIIPKDTTFYMYKNKPEEPVVWREQKLDPEEMDQLILKCSDVESTSICRLFSDEELESKVAKTLETNQEPVSSQNLDNSEEDKGKSASSPFHWDAIFASEDAKDHIPNKRKPPSDQIS